jgi:hypothetical protein
VDDYLKKLVTELGEAINGAVNESEAVNEALDRLRASGNEVFLLLEATIAFKDQQGARPVEPLPFDEAAPEDRLAEISSEDRQFLKNLKISFEGEEG